MPVKIKVFAVVMAVMCLMSLTCTAFAAETDLPPGAQLLTSGAQVSTNKLTSLSTPYVIPAKDVESITISGLFGFSSVYGWDGTQWNKIDVSDPTNVTITCADYPQYSYYTMLRGDTMASQTVTVSWVEIVQPGLMDYLPLVASAVWAQIPIVSAVITGNSLLLFTVGFLFVGGCVAIFGRLLRKS